MDTFQDKASDTHRHRKGVMLMIGAGLCWSTGGILVRNVILTDPWEIGLFALLETTLGPIWVWLGIGERPSDLALLGGLIVIAALLANGIWGMRNRSISS